MNSDKISEILEQQLKAIGQKVRLDILKKLNSCQNSISFSMLQKKVLGTKLNSNNFSFHLKALKNCDLITSNEDGYYLTVLGKKILKNLLRIEQILSCQTKSIMIRTSKYSKEPFQVAKIEDYLVKEGEMEKFLAKKIAQEVRERLSKVNIEYFTAPLMREYINAVLLENGLESVRHKLTRLGTPPYEAFKLFKNDTVSPEKFIQKLGYDVSEQFLLLNLLPNELADLYLSGEVILIHLNSWSLRPLSMYLNADTLLNFISIHYQENSKKIKNSRDLINLILNFIDVIKKFKTFFSGDLLIGDFNNKFLSLFNICGMEEKSYIFDILSSQLLRYNEQFNNFNQPLSLEFCYNGNKTNISQLSNQHLIDKLFLKSLTNKIRLNRLSLNPSLLVDYSSLNQSNLNNIFLTESNPSLRKEFVYYNKKNSNLINSYNINVQKFDKNKFLSSQIILDKILINLHLISLNSNQNDEIFYELLQEKLNSVFELFKYKESLIKKKLNSLKNWKQLLFGIEDGNKNNLINNSLKSVSFFGLNKAIKNHCGIELDRLETSESFALKVLSFLNQLIHEKNEEENDFYSLSQPHADKYIRNSLNIGSDKSEKSLTYSSRIIRKNTTLSLKKQITIFKKFEKVIDGGCKFNSSFDSSNEKSLEDFLKLFVDSELSAFSIK